jgi:hypothetical protein
MEFCEQFLKKPSTRKELKKAFKPFIRNTIKYLQKKNKSQNMSKISSENMLKYALDSFDKSFMETCNRTCSEFENTPHPCGPKNEKIMLNKIKNIDTTVMTNFTINQMEQYASLAKTLELAKKLKLKKLQKSKKKSR